MEIDNLTRYMAYASYACDLAKGKALNLKQEAFSGNQRGGGKSKQGQNNRSGWKKRNRSVRSK